MTAQLFHGVSEEKEEKKKKKTFGMTVRTFTCLSPLSFSRAFVRLRFFKRFYVDGLYPAEMGVFVWLEINGPNGPKLAVMIQTQPN